MKPEAIAFHVITIVITAALIALCSVNVYYFDQLRKNPTAQVTKNTAITMLVLNAVAIGLLALIMVWSIVRCILVACQKV